MPLSAPSQIDRYVMLAAMQSADQSATFAPPGALPGMANVSSPPPRSFVVMVAEDEAIVRMMAVDFLTDAGFVVLEAAHADEALAILKTGADGIHALFTDIHMPGSMTGLELAHYARQHWPWVALLIASGQGNPHSWELPACSRFIPKPYNPEQMVVHVRELTAAG
jgi:CheY-like chemotaxis protein